MVLRSTPARVALRHLLSDGALGSVMQVVLRDDQYLPTPGVCASTRRGERSPAGSGVLMERSIQDLDLDRFEWRFGDIDTVSAPGANYLGIEGIEDSVGVSARFSGGPVASLATVRHDVPSRPGRRRPEVLCERAALVVEGGSFGPVRASIDGEPVERPRPGVRDGLRARELADAVHDSMAVGGHAARIPPSGS